jgi:hypothetical protein
LNRRGLRWFYRRHLRITDRNHLHVFIKEALEIFTKKREIGSTVIENLHHLLIE